MLVVAGAVFHWHEPGHLVHRRRRSYCTMAVCCRACGTIHQAPTRPPSFLSGSPCPFN